MGCTDSSEKNVIHPTKGRGIGQLKAISEENTSQLDKQSEIRKSMKKIQSQKMFNPYVPQNIEENIGERTMKRTKTERARKFKVHSNLETYKETQTKDIEQVEEIVL